MKYHKNIKTTNINEFKESGIKAIYAYADWCNSCKVSDPKIKKIFSEYKDKITIAGLDLSEPISNQMPIEITHVPTFFIFKDGKECYKGNVKLTYEEVKKEIDKIL